VFDPLDHADEAVAARAAMGDQAFEAAWTAGRAMTLDQAIAAVEEALVADPPSSRPPPDPLSPREAEVAALVAQGRSNREIAAALVIAESTADRHLANIFNKLGLHSRAELAAWHERQRARPAIA
jgi:non-specific serine/threonine protein kinase